MMKPPAWEQYWGWVVVFARFLALFMLLGTYKSFGVLMDYYIKDLDASAATAGGATAMFITVIYLAGKSSLVFCNEKNKQINIFDSCLYLACIMHSAWRPTST